MKFTPRTPLSFYAILDTTYLKPEDFTQVLPRILTGQPDLIQIRAKQETTAQRRSLLEAVLPFFDQPGPHSLPRERLIINDDADLCAEFDRIGLHVGQDDLPIDDARQLLGPDRILGLSTHSVEQAREANQSTALSYFAVGPVFATPTKPEAGAVGLELVAAVASWPPRHPVYAIGGIKQQNVQQVIRPGLAGVVVVSELLQATDPGALIENYRKMAFADHPHR